jgi:hypothetical protein
MALSGGIGQIRDAIEAGKAAHSAIDFGPVISDKISGIENTISDWQETRTDNTIFIFGIHRWGSVTNFRVTK